MHLNFLSRPPLKILKFKMLDKIQILGLVIIIPRSLIKIFKSLILAVVFQYFNIYIVNCIVSI